METGTELKGWSTCVIPANLVPNTLKVGCNGKTAFMINEENQLVIEEGVTTKECAEAIEAAFAHIQFGKKAKFAAQDKLLEVMGNANQIAYNKLYMFERAYDIPHRWIQDIEKAMEAVAAAHSAFNNYKEGK